MKGIKHTAKDISKLRTAMLNKKPSMKTRVVQKMKLNQNKAAVVRDVDSGELRKYFSIKHAAEGVNTSSITTTRYL